MVKRINNYYEFKKEFVEKGKGNHLSDAGFKTLFNLITELEDAAGEDLELDVIDLCRQFSELTEKELLENYGLTIEGLDELDILYGLGERLTDDNKLDKIIILDVASLKFYLLFKNK